MPQGRASSTRGGGKRGCAGARQRIIDTHEERVKGVGGGHDRRELKVEACINEAKESLPKTMRCHDELSNVFAQHLRRGLEGAREERPD